MFSGTLVKVLRASHCPPAARLFSQRAARSTGILSGLPERVAARIRPANCSSPILSRLWNNAVVRTSPPHRRNFSSTPHRSAPASELPAGPILSGPPVGGWLLLCSTLVFTVIVVGGVTRLTESGLSITEWKPVTGILPPLSRADWEEEFDKYKSTPEYKMLNAHMSVEDFKDIYYMEWGHRILGRIIGVGFVAPLAYFALKKHLSPGLPLRLSGLAILLGAQGVLGWYMVKSGLNDDILTTPGAVPRVSQYRLASHLGTALALYAGMFYTGIAVMKDWKFAHKGTWAGLRDTGEAWKQSNKALRAFKRNSVLLTALVFLTAFSGAFVAGLDAGLLYNEFPMMGGSLHPPADELIAPAYSGPNGTQSWRNIFENPTTVQFDHRVLGVTTWATTGLVYALTFLRRKTLPPAALRAATLTFGMANIQAVLGISTLLYLVPVPLAASHQAGSIMLLSAALHMILAVRKPGAAAQAWRAAAMSAVGNARAKKAAAESVARTVMSARSGPMSAMKGAGAGPAIAA